MDINRTILNEKGKCLIRSVNHEEYELDGHIYACAWFSPRRSENFDGGWLIWEKDNDWTLWDKEG